MNLLLNSEIRLAVRVGLSVILLVLLQPVWSGSRPVVEDAACDALRLKWESGKRADATTREKNFSLFDAADLGCSALVSRFLESGAIQNAKDRAGNTALLLAARKGHNDTLDILLAADADLAATNLEGSSALLMAAVHNRRKTAEKLIGLGVDPNLANKHGISPLIAAAYNGNGRLVSRVIEAGADPGQMDSTGKAAIVYAAGKGFVTIVRELMESKQIAINQRYGNDLTLLMWAAGFSNDVPAKDGIATIAYLLSQGADPNLTDNRGRTALHVAAQRGHSEVVRILLEHGAAADSLDKEGKAAIDLTKEPVIKNLLDS